MPSLDHMKLLVNLARADGSVADREKNYIMNIARANGVGPEEVASWLEADQLAGVPADLSPDEKFDFVFSMIQLMKVDERLYKEEIVFCSGIAEKLGYDHQVMFDLMLQVKTPTMTQEEIASLKAIIQNHLKH